MIVIEHLVLDATMAVARNHQQRQRVFSFVGLWRHLADEQSRVPTVKEFASRWGYSLATAHNHMAEFKRLFPRDADPTSLVRRLILEAKETMGAAVS